MGKVKFEFDTAEENNDIELCANRYKLAQMLYDIQDYIRNLNKYEERNEIPVEEISEKLSTMIEDWYMISK